jgi:hypothetical protein
LLYEKSEAGEQIKTDDFLKKLWPADTPLMKLDYHFQWP